MCLDGLGHNESASTLLVSHAPREIELAFMFPKVACHCKHTISRKSVSLIHLGVFCLQYALRYASVFQRQ